MIDGELLELFARQYGVAGIHQLADRGISRSAVHRARRRGIIDDVTTGVVRVRSTPLSLRGRAMAVQLRSGSGGLISGWSAGSLVGLRSMPTRSIHVTVPPAFRRAMPDWADVHRSAWYDTDSYDHHGFRLASPMRMLFGLAAAFNQHRFERAAEDAWHLELVTPDEAAHYLDLHRCRGKDGVVRIERWLEHSCGRARPTQSNLERVLLEALDQTGLPRAQRQYPLVLATGETIHLDIAWPDIRSGRRARLVVVPRRRSRPAKRPGPRSRMRRGGMARRPIRRRAARPSAPRGTPSGPHLRPPRHRRRKSAWFVALNATDQADFGLAWSGWRRTGGDGGGGR
jgi:hypothetical protein